MRRLFVVLVLAWSAFASAASSTFAFNEVPLSQLLTFYYKQMVKEDFVLSKDLVGNSTPVTVNLKNVEASKYPEVFNRVFQQYGVVSEQRDGVWFVSLASSIQRQSGGDSPAGLSAVAAPGVSGGPVPGMGSAGAFAGAFGPVGPAGIESSSLVGGLGDEDLDLRWYLPRGRPAADLQLIANKLLRTDYKATDRVLLKGQPKHVERVLALLQEYDAEPATVKVQAYLIEFSDQANSGHSFSVALNALGGKLGINLGTAQASGNFVRIQNQNINAVLTAVDGDSRFHLVDSPNSLCDSGELCRIQVGDSQPVLGSVTLSNSGQSQQSVTYQESGSILEFTPTVMADWIRLKLKQTVSSFNKNTLTNIDSPVILKRMIDSTVSVQDGDIIILGGLEQSTESSSRSGLPFLPSWLDLSRSKSKNGTQLLLVLRIERMKHQTT